MPDVETICRVCGYDTGEELWTSHGDSSNAMFLFCECCGMESGYQDCQPSAARGYRAQWLAAGAPWGGGPTPHRQAARPADWHLDAQLDKVPVPYR